MSGLLNVAARALGANQTVLQTTGNNISNVNTPGYSRQRTVLETVEGQFTGGGFIGKGVSIRTIERNHSEFLTQQAIAASSVFASDSARTEKLRQLEDLFEGGSSGLGAAINDMLNAFSDVVSAPTDLTARTVVVTRGDELASRMNIVASRMADMQQSALDELDEGVDAVNSLATRIAAVNEQIAKARGTGQPPNDLLDQRDRLITDLNRYVQTTQLAADDGTVGVFLANSQALILGNQATRVARVADDFNDPGRAKLAIFRENVALPLEEVNLGGGQLSGQLRFLNNDLPEGRNLLGRIAMTVSTTINTQHRLGLDLDGNTGGDFFQTMAFADGLQASTNTGTATVSTSIADASLFAASEYEVRFNAGGASIERLSDGQITDFPGGLPATVDGLTITLSAGSPNAGDRFRIQPFQSAARDLRMAFDSPRALAVSNPIEPVLGTNNLGALSVDGLKATAANANLTETVTLTFDGAGNVTASSVSLGSVTVPYTPGQALNFNGWQLDLLGLPANGDTVTIRAASPAFQPRDTGNAAALMSLRDLALFDGAAMTDGYASLISQVGIRVQSSSYSTEVSQDIYTNLERDRAGVSGVNLDEEAANLLQYQQAYQASARLIQVAQNVFDSLIQVLN